MSVQLKVKNTFLTIELENESAELKGYRRSLTAPSEDSRDSLASLSTRWGVRSDSDSECQERTGPAQNLVTSDSDSKCQDLTTVMIKNIPCKYTQDWLVEEVAEVTEQFNFLYMPMARKSHGYSLGYAFVNFLTQEHANTFLDAFQGRQFPRQPNSAKRAEVLHAAIQGFSANWQFYRGSKIAKTKFRPYINYELAECSSHP